MSISVILSLLKMSISLQITLAAETHLADGLTFKLLLTTKVKSLILLEGTRMEEQLILFYFIYFKDINKKKSIKMFPSGMKCWNIKSR
jgi:hypothetical protein